MPYDTVDAKTRLGTSSDHGDGAMMQKAAFSHCKVAMHLSLQGGQKLVEDAYSGGCTGTLIRRCWKRWMPINASPYGCIENLF